MNIATLSSSFSRPANTTAYASGDLVADNTTAGSVTPLSWVDINLNNGEIALHWVRLHKSGTTATNASFRVHFFTASPAVANGDNGVFSASQSANYLGYADLTLAAFSDGCAAISAIGTNSPVAATDFPGSGKTIYALIEAQAAYTPASGETFTVSLFTERLAKRF